MERRNELGVRKAKNMTIGERIRQQREQRNMSQAEFARRMGVTRATVSAWEQGVNLPTASYLVDMARLFRVSSDYLLGLSSTNALSLNGLTSQEVGLVYELVNYIEQNHKAEV